ncbi:GGDEF domain-containing protein [Salinicola sp. DM10]|uniref:GGDEF domain-containing protein n=1 Tax=Salinicola sp. DM10 TaxID=2815721 RepID=UPI001A8FFB76|nr:GGDEF domain-containing protein [Salinicola sp. DM10]MCE3026910.1 GGDEF domain-containing protein [Salinicola sp. DM10]
MHMTDDALLTATLSRAAFLLVFLTVVLSQLHERFLWHWLSALIGSSLGTALMAQFPVDGEPGLALGLATYLLFMISLIGSWSGVRLFYRRRVDPRLLGAIILLPLLIYTVLDLFQVALNYRRFVITLACTLPACLTVFEILRPASERLFSPIVVALAFIAYAVALAGTGVALLLNLTPPTQEAVNYPSFAVDRVASILVYFGYIAMAGERANRALRQQAETDQLTGLANRHGAQRALNRLETARTTGAEGVRTSVLLADVDHFKRINDTYGHEVGDSVIVAVAARLRGAVRDGDVAVRWGGEEFLVLLPATDATAAQVIAERLRDAVIHTPVHADGHDIPVTLSIGIAEATSEGETLSAAIVSADRALYRAKRQGRDRVCLDTTQSDEITISSAS